MDRDGELIVDWCRAVAAPLLDALSGKPGELREHPSLYGDLPDRIETFTRPLLAVAPWLDPRALASLPNARSYADAARATILRGTDPQHPEYWGKMQDKYQPIAEASSLAWCLHNARTALWAPLSTSEKQQVADWLGDVQGREVSDSNWHLFPAVTMAFLAGEGYPIDRNELRAHFDRVFNDFYVGAGWYSDGPHAIYDSYNGAMMQPYMHMLDELGVVPEDQHEELHSRSLQWTASMLNIFDEEGVAPFWGRSGLYRLNYLDGVAMPFRRGMPVANAGDWRRAIAGCCSYFAPDAILDEKGYLLCGFLGRKEDIVDWYNVRGSAYWMGRVAHLVQIDRASPFWNEQAAPWESGLVHLNPVPLSVNRQPRHVVVWNLGASAVDAAQEKEKNQKWLSDKDHVPEKYHNLLWSGRFGQAYDSNAAALFCRESGRWRPLMPRMVGTDAASATAEANLEAGAVRIAFAVAPDGSSRISVTNTAPRPVELRAGGFAVSGDVREVENGLAGVEGRSCLAPLHGFRPAPAGHDDGIHLWAEHFSYPTAEATLGQGDTAAVDIAGLPGNWHDVLKLHGGR